MDAQRLTKIQAIFSEAVELTGEERDAYVDRACEGDRRLKADVLRYLDADAADVFSFIDRSLSDLPLNEHSGERESFAVGQQIGTYEIKRLLGKGGMGQVYLALDHRLERHVALKMLSPQLSYDESAKNRLMSEARAAAALDHPHVATIFEVGEADGNRLFISMGYYEGETLAHRIERGPIGVAESSSIVRQVLLGLEAAHEKRIVHRDIKPANLIITPGGRVKIVDFGIAKVAGRDQASQGRIMGTAAYMSPEQSQGLDIDHRTDLWSVGVVLYEMVAGSKPFKGDFLEAVKYEILYGTPPPLSEFSDEVDQEFQRVVDRLLAKSKEQRYQRAREVIEDLDRLSARLQQENRQGKNKVERLPFNLPSYVSSFVGRENELSEVVDLLDRARLITITGTGGAGKTRFSLFVAEVVAPKFEGGVAFISLAGLRDAGRVVSTIAQTLEVRAMEGVSLEQRLVDALRNTKALLILDNFEHVLDARELVSTLLAECNDLSIVVTSRFSLRIRGEHEYPLPALSIARYSADDSLQNLKRCESVALFEQRARAIKPSFAVDEHNISAVLQICRRLDGLPLAIELAAARIKVLPPRVILERLGQRLNLLTTGAKDLPERHRTLREAIAWSYDLLEKEEKRLFRIFSVFGGPFMLEAAEFVGNRLGVNSEDILDGLESLVDKNLVIQEESAWGDVYFYTLETVREFGQECLVASGEQAPTRFAHQEYYLSFAESGAPHLGGPDQKYWLDRFEKDHPNFRLALDLSAPGEETVCPAARIAAALWRFWLIRGYLNEGMTYLSKVLGLLPESENLNLRGRLLSAQGTLAHNCGQFRRAQSLYLDHLSVCRSLGDSEGIAQAHNNLGWAKWRLSEYADAIAYSEEGLRLHEEGKNAAGEAAAHTNLGWIAQHQGRFDAAQLYFERALEAQIARDDERNIAFAKNCLGWAIAASGDLYRGYGLLREALRVFEGIEEKQLTAFSQSRLGVLAHAQGEMEEAKYRLQQEGLPAFRTIGDAWGVGFVASGLGHVLFDEGDFSVAADLYDRSLTIRREIEDRWGEAEICCRIAELRLATKTPEAALPLYIDSLRIRKKIGDRHGQIESLEGVARTLHGNADDEHAIYLMSIADTARLAWKIPRKPREQRIFAEQRDSLQRAFGREAFDARWKSARSESFNAMLKKILSGDDVI